MTIWDRYNPEWCETWKHAVAAVNYYRAELCEKTHRDDITACKKHITQWKQSEHDAWVSQFKNAADYADHLFDTLSVKAKRVDMIWTVNLAALRINTYDQAIQFYDQNRQLIESFQATPHSFALYDQKDSFDFLSKEFCLN